MSFKRGIALKNIQGAEPELLGFLKEHYGITTCEELIEASAFSRDLEIEAEKHSYPRDSFRTLYEEAYHCLGGETARVLQEQPRRFATGALEPFYRRT